MPKARCLLCCIALLLCGLFLGACTPAPPPAQALHVVMSAPDGLRGTENNYYRQWLEERTGLAITVELVEPSYMPEYLRLLFQAQESGVDAIFFAPEDGISAELLAEYGAAGHILPLDSFVGEATATNMAALFETHTDYDLKAVLTAPDGKLYYMPNLNSTTARHNAQTLWMNAAWLKQAGVTLPLTTDDFTQVLRAFKAQNAARGNDAGLAIAGNGQKDAQFVLHTLMNAFEYTDPQNGYLAMRGGQVYFAPATEAWRQGLVYCRGLYEEGLLPDACFSFTDAQFVRLVNDTRDLVGSFTAGSIGDVLLAGSPALSSRFIHVPPLAGPDGTQYATVQTSLPTPGGVITATCQNPQAAFALMDTMLGEDAYLVAAFGQQGVDWDTAALGDIGYNGEAALITVTSPEWGLEQDRNFLQAGPFVTHLRYADGVAWNGYQADQRYLDARAARAYKGYAPDEYIRVLILDADARAVQDEVKAYARLMLERFVTGEEDPADDAAWQRYLQKLNSLGVDALLNAAQTSCQSYGGN